MAGATFRPDRRDFEKMLRFLQRGATGVAELVDGSGAVVASTERGRVGQQGRVLAPDGAARAGEEDARDAVRRLPRGARRRAAPARSTSPSRRSASAPWGVVVRQSAAEALPTRGRAPVVRGASPLLAAQFAVAGVFAWGAARSVTGPGGGAHRARASGSPAGELAWPIPELGEDEVGRLGKSLEQMRQNLARAHRPRRAR